MDLSISNLAWDHKDLESILKILKEQNIKKIEGVLTKINTWDLIDEVEIENVKNKLKSYDIEMGSIQSIFYGVDVKSLNDKSTILQHIKKLIKFSKILGYTVLVFGSPNLRNNFNYETIVNILNEIDELLVKNNITMCIEPNSKIYKGDYFHTITEIVEFLNKNNFKNIKTMIDTHNLLLEGEDPIDMVESHFNSVSHIHVSENGLLPISNLEFHKKFSEKLKSVGYSGIITYELLQCDNLEEQIKQFKKIYN